MKRKFVLFLLLVVLLSAYPVWRIREHSILLADTVISQASLLGQWSYRSMQPALLSDTIELRNVVFTPNGHRQGFNIGQLVIQFDSWQLMLEEKHRLISHLPTQMAVLFKNVQLNNAGTDLQQSILENGYWPLMAGYLGGFGCGETGNLFFTPEQWHAISSEPLTQNVELQYSNVGEDRFEFNLNAEAQDMWYVNWSGTLESGSAQTAILNDMVLESLYYYYQDLGFNLKRNNMCAEQYNNSVAAYRLNSASQLQKYLRLMANQELPETVYNWYQRSLNPEAEFNVIFNIKDKNYMAEILKLTQNEFFAQFDMEVALGENEYLPVVLEKIDHLALNEDVLREEFEIKQSIEKAKQEAAQQTKPLVRTIKYTVGSKKRSLLDVSDWHSAVGNNVRIKTRRGRPIYGKLLAVSDDRVRLSSRFATGNAEITVLRNKILSLNIVQ